MPVCLVDQVEEVAMSDSESKMRTRIWAVVYDGSENSTYLALFDGVETLLRVQLPDWDDLEPEEILARVMFSRLNEGGSDV